MQNLAKFFIVALLACAAGLTHAEQSDRYQAMTIDADKVTVDEAKKTSVFEGHVVISQGSMLVKAQRVSYRQDSDGDYFITATGNPITFRQKQDNSPDAIEASSRQLEFNSKNEQARLSGKAVLKRGQDEVRGDSIFYDMRSQQYEVKGGKASGDADGGRVRLVIQPKKKPVNDGSAVPLKPGGSQP